eukprot:evm.model.scf_95.3 EVM.evm.TU.scf_95.3   scf_95:127259-128024(-)
MIDINFHALDMVFEGNSGSRGGAVAATGASHLRVESSRFTHNLAHIGGALYAELDSVAEQPRAGHCQSQIHGVGTVFDGNSASVDGGAVSVRANPISGLRKWISPHDTSAVLSSGTDEWQEDAIFESSDFIRNGGSNAGGALHAVGAQLRCQECLFRHNTVVQNDTGSGGAVFIKDGSALRGSGVDFASNNASTGGGLYARDSLVDLAESSFERNIARGDGGGLCVHMFPNSSFFSGMFARINSTTFGMNSAQFG